MSKLTEMINYAIESKKGIFIHKYPTSHSGFMDFEVKYNKQDSLESITAKVMQEALMKKCDEIRVGNKRLSFNLMD